MTTYYYGNDAIKAFGIAMSQRYGVEVEWVAGSRKACTDGFKVYLPDLAGYMDQDAFEGICGICIHELAHCQFRTVEHMKDFVDAMEKKGVDKGLAASCYNCVVDVHDETRLELLDQRQGVWRSTYLLRQTARYCACKAVNNDMLTVVKPGHEVWQAQTCAIFMVRPGVETGMPTTRLHKRHHFWISKIRPRLRSLWGELFMLGVDMPAIRKVLLKAKIRRTKTAANAPMGWKRDSEIAKLGKLAEELIVLLAPIHKPDNESGDDGETGIAGTQGAGNGCGSAKTKEQMEDDCDAVESDGIKLPDLQSDKHEQGGCESGAAGVGTGISQYKYNCHPDPDTLNTIGRYVQSMIDQAAADCRDEIEFGFSVGGYIGDLHRLATDGLILGRNNPDGREEDDLCAAILLDTSGSMGHCIKKCAAVAEAFRIGIEGIGKTRCWTFSTRYKEVEGFADFPYDGGGTNASGAVVEAMDWLEKVDINNRYMIIITDGMTSGEDVIARRVRLASAAGVRTIVLYLGHYAMPTAAETEVVFPGAMRIMVGSVGEMALGLMDVGRALTGAFVGGRC